MRLIYTAYLPVTGGITGRGGSKVLFSLFIGLLQRGHAVTAIVADERPKASTDDVSVIDSIKALGAELLRSDDEVEVFGLGGVEMHGVRDPARLPGYFERQIRELHADWLLLDSPDWLELDAWLNRPLMEVAVRSLPGRVVVLNQVAPVVPPRMRERIIGETRAALAGAHLLSVSEFSARHMGEVFGLHSEWMYFPVFGLGPFPDLSRYDQGYVTMVNPSAIKGIAIFAALARSMPEVAFAAVPTWATTEADIALLCSLPNVRLLEAAPDIADILAQTRVMLVPSLWLDAWTVITIESMLHGIPVLASKVGGVSEAKLGTRYLLPARPYEDCDDQGNPLIPEQDIGPWRAALEEILSDPEIYRRESSDARSRATAFVSGLSIAPFEEILRKFSESPTSGSARA